ncbi:MAG: hypothetical protein RL477_1688 [Pseudomonadota bacterium]
MALPAPFVPIVRVFGYREYALFMGGMGPNLVTLWMQRLGMGWLAWELTESPTWLGIIAAADLAPMILLAPLAGAFTDRQDPVRLQIITQWLNAAIAAALALFTFVGWMRIELLLLLALLGGIVHPFASTARHAIVPRTVPHADFATAIATDSALFHASRFIGPALAAPMIAFGGIEVCFAANALTELWFVLLLMKMQLDFSDRRPHKGRNILGDIGVALTYVRGHAGIWPLFILMTAVSICLRPLQDMLPGFAGAVFDAGATGLAWLTASMGVGATLSASWIAMRGRVGGLTTVVLAGGAMVALATFGFIATANLWVAVLFGAGTGFALTVMSTGTQALIQSALTDDLRGRVMGLYTLIYRGLPALGALALGAIAEVFGLRVAFAAAAALMLVACIWVVPRRRAMVGALEAERRP